MINFLKLMVIYLIEMAIFNHYILTSLHLLITICYLLLFIKFDIILFYQHITFIYCFPCYFNMTTFYYKQNQPQALTNHCKLNLDGNAPKPHISKMHNVQETQKNCFKSKQTGNRVFAISIFAILVDFVFIFRYKPLTLYRG